MPYITTGDAAEPYFDTTALSNDQLWAAGGVVATTGDANDFYRALTDGTLLDAAQLAEMSDHVDTGAGLLYGLGLAGLTMGCPDDPDEIFWGHTGGGLGHQTYSFHSLDGERQVTVTWNIDDRHGAADPQALSWAVSGLLFAGLCGADLGDRPEDADPRTRGVPSVEALRELSLIG
ncbi:serine hydrolase [Glycomyces harbinensis]|uniref:D-alanyl-D-alanine carboxypeptidase n=1 Tax=Glycomyces harbinensis TaxID=58114 RepID=A0A1G6ZBC5_9ACTN|nr:serine hydrolase [Glycomyces harbinensis]SDD99989.1 D-alanyl-D-alanine carboxypeptidase [Glycomyces harbinensis]